jgi:sugar lactone lactonase YvrE
VRINPAGEQTILPVPVMPSKLLVGPDGNIWFSDLTSTIGKISADGTVSLYAANSQGYSAPNFLTVGADGNIWFALRSGATSGAIGRITTGGQLSVFSKGLLPKAFPNCITLGPDGNVWFTDQIGAVGKVTVDGRITEYTAGMSPNARPRMIASGQDGALWVTESANGRLARVTTGGVITELSPTGLSSAVAPVAPAGAAFGNNVIGITSSADGTLWVAEGVLGRIAIVTTGYANVATGFDLQNIQTSIAPGTLILSTPYSTGSPLVLPPMTLNDAATEYATSANFASIAVADTRPGNLPYTVSAIASPLVKAGVPTPSVDETISSENVGLTNLQLVSTNSTPNTFIGGQIFGLFSGPENFVGFDNAAAAHVSADDAGSLGLGGSSPHPVLHANSGLGRTETSGTLTITAPTNTRDGTYNGTLTFSIIGS